jgi:hypothetical protein
MGNGSFNVRINGVRGAEKQRTTKASMAEFLQVGVTVELPRLTSREIGCDFLADQVVDPLGKIPKYLEALDRERISLGLKPGYVSKEF